MTVHAGISIPRLPDQKNPRHDVVKDVYTKETNQIESWIDQRRCSARCPTQLDERSDRRRRSPVGRSKSPAPRARLGSR